MATKTIAVIQGEIVRYFEPENICCFFGNADIDADGSGGNPQHDPWFQPDTSYHYNGKALNAYTTNFIAVPPQIVKGVAPIVLGCHCRVRDMRSGKRAVGLVGDIGPRSKVGEMSVAMANELGINSNPVTGGESEVCFFYELFPGRPAEVNGVTYPLQPS